MSGVQSSPQAGRYQSLKVEKTGSLTFTSQATGSILDFPVLFDQIEILAVGIVLTSDSDAVGTGAEVTVQRRAVTQASFATIFTGAKVTVTANGDSPNAIEVDLDQSVIVDGDSGKAYNYVQAYKGDMIRLNLTVQGVSGTQVGYAYLVYRERPTSN